MLGIERIKILGSEVKDKALLKVIEYLVSREDMNEKYLNEEKSLKQMVEYIKSEAKKQAVNGMAMIKDCVYSEDGITYMSDKQYNNRINIIVQLQQENQSLKKENKILRENAEHNDKVVDKVNWENLKLKKELEEYKKLNNLEDDDCE